MFVCGVNKMDKKVAHNTNNTLEAYRFYHNISEIFAKRVMSNRKDDYMARLKKALFYAKVFLQSSNVLLYKMDKYGEYNCYSKGSVREEDNRWLRILINQCKKTIESKEVFTFDCEEISKIDKDVVLVPLLMHYRKYILAIKNSELDKLSENKELMNMIRKVMNNMIDRIEEYNEISRKGRKDDLTGLDNRYAYEEALKEIDRNKDPYIIVEFDLYRLKHVNDTYGLPTGDAYIIKTGDILKKYFSKYRTYRDEDNSIKKQPTGSCIYRWGGDEFFLISKNESLDEVYRKIKLIQEEVSQIELNTKEALDLGINYALVCRVNGEKVSELAPLITERMNESKREMYLSRGIDRRK